MVAFDNTVLSLLIFPDADQRQGKDGQTVDYARERVIGLVQSLEDERERVVVPSPALAELLVTEGADVQDILSTLRSSSYIRIESFDERAAVELAMRLRAARRVGDQREGVPITKSEMKFDRQIVAIALVSGASVLYSDDIGVARFAAGCGLAVKGVGDLPIPSAQQALDFPEPVAQVDTSPGEEALPSDGTETEGEQGSADPISE